MFAGVDVWPRWIVFQFLTPQVFDAPIWGVILIGLVLAALRLYRDLFMPRRGRRPATGAWQTLTGDERQGPSAALPDEQEK